MLPELHDVLRTLIYERGHIGSEVVDVRFEAPTRGWMERLTRPTICLFLFRIEENVDLRRTSFQTRLGASHATRKLPPRRIELHFMVSALTTEIEDEHALLWRALATLMGIPELPAEVLPNDLRHEDAPVSTRTAQPNEDQRLLDLWDKLGVDPHPSFTYRVTIPLDLDVAISSPLVLTRTTRLRRSPENMATEEHLEIGGTVRSRDGRPLEGVEIHLDGSTLETVTDGSGRFRLPRVPLGDIGLHLRRPDGDWETVKLIVPSASYDIVLDERVEEAKVPV